METLTTKREKNQLLRIGDKKRGSMIKAEANYIIMLEISTILFRNIKT